VEAQKEYAQERHDHSQVNQYAQRIISMPGNMMVSLGRTLMGAEEARLERELPRPLSKATRIRVNLSRITATISMFSRGKVLPRRWVRFGCSASPVSSYRSKDPSATTGSSTRRILGPIHLKVSRAWTASIPTKTGNPLMMSGQPKKHRRNKRRSETDHSSQHPALLSSGMQNACAQSIRRLGAERRMSLGTGRDAN
jgi:Protein of unknown function (DUF2950)